jgi:hypothetical protein
MRYESFEYHYRKVGNSAERSIAIWVSPVPDAETYGLDEVVVINNISIPRFEPDQREEIGSYSDLSLEEIPQNSKDLSPRQ